MRNLDIYPDDTPVIALDADYTTFNTGLFFDETVALIADAGILPPEKIWAARAATEKTRGSFDTMGYLADNGVPQDVIDDLCAVLAENKQGIDYVFPDAHRLLDQLTAAEVPFFTLTKGSMANQLSKLRSAGLDQYPYRVTDDVLKGRYIAAQQVGDRFDIPLTSGGQVSAKRGVLIEDKLQALEGLPSALWLGILVVRGPMSEQPIPEGVEVVTSLEEVPELIARWAKDTAGQ